MRFLLVPLVLMWSSYSLAECAEPQAPTIPDGGTSTEQEMIAGMQGLKGYMTDSNAYLECLKGEEMAAESAAEAAGQEYPADKREAAVERHNGIVDIQERLATEWSEELAEFKAKPK